MSEVKVFTLSAADFRAARPELPQDYVPLPEFGAGARGLIRGLSGNGRDGYEASLLKAGKKGQQGQQFALDDVRARLVARCLIDESGSRVFTDSPEDVAIVSAWPATAVHRLFEKAKELSGMTDAEVEELGKTYGAAQSGS